MALSQEKFEEMIKEMDKDGDGSVDKDEFKLAWKKCVDPDLANDAFEALWKKIDADGDGSLTANELAKHFGFDMASGSSLEMSDEQILQALMLDDTLKDEAKDKPKAEEPAPVKKKARDDTIKTHTLEKKKADPTDKDSKEIAFLENCQLAELRELKTAVEDMNGSWSVRCEDEKGEMALHKMARVTVKKDGTEGAGKPEDVYRNTVKAIVDAMRKELEPAKRSLYDDVNHADKAGKTPLYLAIEYKNRTLIEILYDLAKEGPDSLLANAAGWTVMHAAVHTDDLDTLKALVKRLTPGRLTALLKSADKTGREPLHIAAYKCSEEMVKYLVEKGATANKEDSAGNTASKLADRGGRRKSREIIDNASGMSEGGADAPKGRRKSRDSKEPKPAEPAAAPATA